MLFAANPVRATISITTTTITVVEMAINADQIAQGTSNHNGEESKRVVDLKSRLVRREMFGFFFSHIYSKNLFMIGNFVLQANVNHQKARSNWMLNLINTW